MFILFRFVTALGVGGVYSAVTSAIAEFMPARHLGRSDGLVMTYWALGGILASLVSILVITALGLGWRYTLLFGVLSAGYGLLARRLIPESPRWLASRDRLDEADEVVAPGSPGSPARAVTSRRRAPGRVAAGWPSCGPRTGGELDRLGRRPTVTFSYLLAALSMLVVALAAATGTAGAVLAATATALSLTSMFVLLGGGFWLIGALAGAVWWRYGVEARGQNLEALAAALTKPQPLIGRGT